MKKTTLINLFILFCCCFTSQAQQKAKGIILDAKTKQPITFVNIGVLKTSKGTVSDGLGHFDIKVKEDNAIIHFSSIGYENKTIEMDRLTNLDTLFLTPKAYDIQTIVVESKKWKEEQLKGHVVNKKNTIISWTQAEQSGVEIGIKIKLDRESLIKSAHFGMHRITADSIKLRVNIYDFRDGKVGGNLMPENVFVTTDSIKDYIHVDLSHLNLIVNHDVLLALEAIEKVATSSKKQLAFRMKQNMFSGNIYYRDAKHGTFYKEGKGRMVKENVGFYLMVKETD